jgi:predicted RNA binding protein YcfA (HicA-like mRNA interferase family)
MPGKIKVNFKMPPETAAEKLYRKHQELRKKSGLPDPEHYKKLAAQKQKEIDDLRKENVEMLDEMPESSMKTRDVHAHLKKAGWALKRTGGGHDVYAHPKSKEHIAVPRHKQLKAPLIRGILKASRVSEEAEIDEQLQQKGKFVSGPVKKPYKSPTVVTPIREAKDPREYDYEGDMAMSQLRSLVFNAEDMMDMMDENTNLPEWVQSKITLAEDYISTAANYLRGELTEEVKRYVPSPHSTPVSKKPKGEYERKVDKYLKKKYNKEEVELDEGIQQTLRKVVPGYAKKQINDKMDAGKFGKTDADKDANYYRYKKVMDKVKKEEVEQLDELSKGTLKSYLSKKLSKPGVPTQKDVTGAANATVRLMGKKPTSEEVELEEENKPTNPELWSKAKSLAKSKFDVYPSAYANGWAAKWYKSKGGGWKSVSEETEKPESRKARIVRDLVKDKKNAQEEASDKFQKDPEISSEIQKN